MQEYINCPDKCHRVSQKTMKPSLRSESSTTQFLLIIYLFKEAKKSINYTAGEGDMTRCFTSATSLALSTWHQCYWIVKRYGYLVLLDNLQAEPTSLLFDIFVQVVSMIY